MYKRILICTDGSSVAKRAEREGIKLAASVGARALVLFITAPFEPPAGYESSPLAAQIERHERESVQTARRILSSAAKYAADLGVPCRVLHVGSYPPAATIVETAIAEHCDLVVMGSHGHGAFAQFLLGSVTTRVAATCTVPLLIVRGASAKSGSPNAPTSRAPRKADRRKG